MDHAGHRRHAAARAQAGRIRHRPQGVRVEGQRQRGPVQLQAGHHERRGGGIDPRLGAGHAQQRIGLRVQPRVGRVVQAREHVADRLRRVRRVGHPRAQPAQSVAPCIVAAQRTGMQRRHAGLARGLRLLGQRVLLEALQFGGIEGVQRVLLRLRQHRHQFEVTGDRAARRQRAQAFGTRGEHRLTPQRNDAGDFALRERLDFAALQDVLRHRVTISRASRYRPRCRAWRPARGLSPPMRVSRACGGRRARRGTTAGGGARPSRG